MTRTPARFTQADISRAIRAAKQGGADSVELHKDGSILIRISDSQARKAETEEEGEGKERDPYVQAVMNSGLVKKNSYDEWKRSSRQTHHPNKSAAIKAAKIYSQTEWEAAIRIRSLGVREKRALGAFFRVKDSPLAYVKGGSMDPCERLVARGLLQVAEDRGERIPFHRITAEGERLWLELATREGVDF